MILETILLASLFHHKHKPVTPSPAQVAYAKLIEEDHSVVANGIVGAQAFESDTKFAQYERTEIDDFERQLFKCTNDTDAQLDPDVDVLIELGNKLMAVDKALHKAGVI